VRSVLRQIKQKAEPLLTLNVVEGSQEVKCGLKYVILTLSRQLLILFNNLDFLSHH
jgi:hypothetical protein